MQSAALGAVLAGVGLLSGSDTRAQAPPPQDLLGDTFSGPTSIAPVGTLNVGAPGFPCLTADPAGAPGPSTITNCNLGTPDPANQGVLRFTSVAEQQASAIVAATSLPTAQGLSLSFKQFQWGGYGLGGPGTPGGADGISFFLAVAPPSPATLGPQGGALGYASDGSAQGLPGAWLGIGLDAFGNFSNPQFGSPSCPVPPWAGFNPNSITVRGPGHGTDGYCLLSSSSDPGVSGFLDGTTLRDDTRALSERTIYVVIDPSTGLYTVSIDPGDGVFEATSGPLPTSYYDPATGAVVNGLPPRITFGFAASTGSATDFHEVSTLTATTVSGSVPVLGLTKSNTLAAPPHPGDSFDYVITPRVDGTVTENDPLSIQVTDTLPAGVTLAGPVNGAGWNCQPLSTVEFSCTNGNPAPIPAGTMLPEIRVPVTLDAGLAPGTVLVNTATVISSDAALPVSASNTVVLSVAGPALEIVTATLPGGTVGASYAAALAATGGAGGYTWSLDAGVLPGGLVISPDGSISGTPTAPGAFDVTVRVTDSDGAFATRMLSIAVAAALEITTASLPGGTAGVVYSSSLQAIGGTGTRVWSVSGGSLPGGLALSAAGVLSGTPTVDGTFDFTVQVADAVGAVDTQAFSVTIVTPVTVAAATLPYGRAGEAYAAAVTASGGVVPYVWTLASGPLPEGLTLGGDGSIAGTPTTPGTFGFTVQVADARGATALGQFSIVVTRLAITPVTLPEGEVGLSYPATALAAVDGIAPYVWTLDSGALPAGLSMFASGVLSGTPTAAGTFPFVVRVGDASGATTTAGFSIAIAQALDIATTSLPGGTVGVEYSTTLAATGGSGTRVWSLAAGALPDGLTLSAGGVISGTPTTGGTFGFTARVTDALGAVATQALSIVVPTPVSITTSALPGGQVGVAYSSSLAAAGGTQPYAWSLAAGMLPAGITLSADGTISGTPSAAGSSAITVQVNDAQGGSDQRSLSIVISELIITTVSLPTGQVSTPYATQLQATGGSGGLQWTRDSGTLPAGLTVSAGGLLSGVPTEAGVFPFVVRVTDAANATATRELNLQIAALPLAVTTLSLPAAEVGVPYGASVAAEGGAGSYVWSIASGSLPSGLALSAQGVISGTPGAASTSGFTVRVTDGAGTRATRRLRIVVVPAVTITTTTLPGGSVGTAYAATLTRAGGLGPFVWSLASGGLPAGLSVSATGVITGVPSSAGTASFTVQVVDALGGTGARALSIVVQPRPDKAYVATWPRDARCYTGGLRCRQGLSVVDLARRAVVGFINLPYLPAHLKAAAGGTRALAVGLGAAGSPATWHSHFAVVDAATDAIRAQVLVREIVIDAEITADGSRVVSLASGTGNTSEWALTVRDGATLATLATHRIQGRSAYSVTLSADETQAYVMTRLFFSQTPRTELTVIDLSTGAVLTHLMLAPDDTTFFAESLAEITPDGERLMAAYHHSSGYGLLDIRVADPSVSDRIVTSQMLDMVIPDNSRLIGVTWQGSGLEFFLQEISLVSNTVARSISLGATQPRGLAADSARTSVYAVVGDDLRRWNLETGQLTSMTIQWPRYTLPLELVLVPLR